jgi:hypothetical protein
MIERRFWAKVDKTAACWVWTASVDAKGYGRFALGSREDGIALAHRVAWWLTYGAWPTGVLDHLCFNSACVNPALARAAVSARARLERSAQRADAQRWAARVPRVRPPTKEEEPCGARSRSWLSAPRTG